jgi:hypothetical protein
MREQKYTSEELAEIHMRLYSTLIGCVGQERKIGMGELFQEVFKDFYSHRINDTKALRVLITRLREEGVPVMSSQSKHDGGYWIAANSFEINEYCEKLKNTAIGKLSRIAKMKKISLPEYLGQLKLDFEQAISQGNSTNG